MITEPPTPSALKANMNTAYSVATSEMPEMAACPAWLPIIPSASPTTSCKNCSVSSGHIIFRMSRVE